MLGSWVSHSNRYRKYLMVGEWNKTLQDIQQWIPPPFSVVYALATRSFNVKGIWFQLSNPLALVLSPQSSRRPYLASQRKFHFTDRGPNSQRILQIYTYSTVAVCIKGFFIPWISLQSFNKSTVRDHKGSVPLIGGWVSLTAAVFPGRRGVLHVPSDAVPSF